MNDYSALAKLSPVEDITNNSKSSSEIAEIESFPSPNNPPWTTGIAFIFWFLSVLLIFVVPIVFLLPYLITNGSFNKPSNELAQFLTSDQTSIVIQMLAIIPAHLFTIIFAWLIITNRSSYPFKDMLGFASGGIKWWHHLLFFLAFAGFAGLVSSYIPESDNELTRILKSSRSAVFVVALIATFSAPFVEEVVYRGVLYSAFQRSMGTTPAVIVVTMMFALVHVPQYYESPSVIFLLTILSLILTLMRAFSGNLLPCIIFHTIVNGVQSLALVLEPYAQPVTEQQVSAILPFK